jgi:hypothetical protein
MHWIGAHPVPSAKRENDAPAKNHWRARLSAQPSAVTRMKEHVQQYDSEPRWPAVIAILAVGGLYTALPDSLTVGPDWLFPSLVLALLIPTIVSYHAGRDRLNAILGLAVDGVLTIGLIVSARPQRGTTAALALGSLALDHEHFGFRFVVLATGCRRTVSTG